MWEEQLVAAARAGDAAGIACILDGQATSHAGTAPSRIKLQAVKLIGRAAALADLLIDSPSPSAQEIGGLLLADQYADRPDHVLRQLRRLAESDHWEVREWVASAVGVVLKGHCVDAIPRLRKWEGALARRAAAIGVKYAPNVPPALALSLLEPMMADPDPYLRKNLGPFTIGDGLLPRHPGVLLPWLEQLAGAEDEWVRWNVAMAFTAAAARPFREQAERILSHLAADGRRTVTRAALAARRSLAK